MLSEHDAPAFEADGAAGRTPADRLLDAAEVSDLLAVPVTWVREHSRNGHLPHVRLGRYVRYRQEAILEWLAEQEQTGAAWGRHVPKERV